jgi:hypothetical protein
VIGYGPNDGGLHSTAADGMVRRGLRVDTVVVIMLGHGGEVHSTALEVRFAATVYAVDPSYWRVARNRCRVSCRHST